MNKYENDLYVSKYAALWAFGYINGFGQTEGLYRTVNELCFSALRKEEKYNILDVGCGVGRTSRDIGAYFNNSNIIAIDVSDKMLKVAKKINKTNKLVTFNLNDVGFGTLQIQGEYKDNITFLKTNIFSMNISHKFDLITCVNVLDRVNEVNLFIEKLNLLLKPNGILILASPLNFANHAPFLSLNMIIDNIKNVGFKLDLMFDNLLYREILDIRGAFEEYPVLILKLRK